MALKLTQKSIGDQKMHKVHGEHGSSHKKGKYSDSNMKPDKTCHYKHEDLGTLAKNPTKLPGQMYVPKHDSNESENFAGDKR
jgi:hypothetical protein